MKFNKSSQLLLVSAASLLVAGLVTACGTLTVDFVFVASSKAAGTNNYGEMDVLEINSESGAMRHIPTSPFPSGGRNPVAEAVSSDNTNLYVVNQDDNSIVQFIIGNDGKLYPQNTTNTPGIYPVAVAVNGKNLFVVDTYQPLPICSTAAPCSGSIAVYPITSSSSTPPSDSIGSNPVPNGSLTYWPLSLPGKPNDVIEPTGINVLASGAFLYVAAYDATSSANYLFGFSVAPPTTSSTLTGGPCPASGPIPVNQFPAGTLCPLNSGAPLAGGPFATGTCTNAFLNAPYVLGTCPSAIASATANSTSYVYVTNAANGAVLGYSVGSTGLLTEVGGSPFPAGNQPSAIVADPEYPYLYVANALDSTVQAYSMSSGQLISLGTYAAGSEPVAIGIDPSTNHFLFTANYLGSGINGTVSGFELSSTAGTLVNSQNSPYTVNAFPTAVAAIPHGVTQSSKQN
ncbi:MAG: beta-propeller fold lactonase family protein [Terracidiphilus sp.]